MQLRASPRAERSAEPGLSRSISYLFLLAPLALVAPLLAQIPDHLTQVLSACLLLLCARGLLESVLRPGHVLELLCYSFLLSYLALPAIYQLANDTYAWHDPTVFKDSTRVHLALVLLVVSLVAFQLGSASYRRRASTSAADDGNVGLKLTTGRPRYLLPLVYLALALGLLPSVLHVAGGLSGLFSSRNTFKNSLAAAGISQQSSGGVAVALVSILPAALAVAAAYLLLLQRRRRPSGYRLLLFAIAFALVVVYANPFSSTRYLSGAAFLPLLLLKWSPRNIRGNVLAGALCIGVLVFIYPLANYFRLGDSATPGQTVSQYEILSGPDYDGFQQVVNTIQYVQDQGHTDGRQTLSAVLFMVPRSVWSSKALPASLAVADNRGYTFLNLSLPLPAELFMDFGWFGVALGMFGLGRLWRKLDFDWAHSGSTAGLLVPYLAFAQFGILRGPLGAQVPVCGATIILLLVGGAYVRRNARVTSSKSEKPAVRRSSAIGAGNRTLSRDAVLTAPRSVADSPPVPT